MEFFENDNLFENTFQMVLNHRGKSYETISRIIRPYYNKIDVSSYDCHSFAFKLFESLDYNIPKNVDINLNRDNFSNKEDYELEVKKFMKKRDNLPEIKPIKSNIIKMIHWIEKNSIEFYFEPCVNVDRVTKNRDLIYSKVLNKLKKSTSSRYIHFSGKYKNDTFFIHSSIILGEINNKICMIEKEKIASEIIIKDLKDMIERYCTYIPRESFPNYKIHILKSDLKDYK